ncbi:right-handed parallel beta-helix repeat-containing protein [Kribbella sp. NPDC004875]|uniref:right-handed parallel beta-helix repeat-containing protein n=1 Tax=Kribbella sp. NPDC004875 TaxID=3364107 RepID=UPI0036AC779B
MSADLSRRTVLNAGLAAATVGALAVRSGRTAAAAPPATMSNLTPEGTIRNLPDSFYDRPGLEGMPHIDYGSMPVVSVRAHGAAGDGITNDRPAFDAALAALGAAGGVVYVPAGRYRFAPPAAPTVDYWFKKITNIHFVGDGEVSMICFERFSMTVPGTPSGGNGWELTAADCSIRSLAFQWSPHVAIRHTNSSTALLMRAPQRVQLIDVVADQGQPSIWLPDCVDTWVVDSTVRNSGADAFHFENATNSVLAYNYVENCLDDAYANIPETRRPAATTQHGVRITHNTAVRVAGGRGVCFGGSQPVIEHNWIESSVSAAIYAVPQTDAGDPATIPRGTITGAVIADNDIVRAGFDNRTDNIGLNRTTGGYGGTLVVVDAVEKMTIARNRITDSEHRDITFGQDHYKGITASSITVSGNELRSSLDTSVTAVTTVNAAPVNITGLTLEGNTILGGELPTVMLDGTIKDVSSSFNIVRRPPRRTSQATGDLTGYRIGEQQGTTDVYRPIRLADNEHAWQEPAGIDLGGLRHVNVRTYGARGDGVHNDLPAFVAATHSLPTSGGVIDIPAGTYRLEPDADNESFRGTRIRHHLALADRRNVHLQGTGGASRLVMSSAEHDGIRFLGVDHGSISRLRIELEARPAMRRNRALIDVSGCDGFAVCDLEVSGGSGPGVRVDSSRSVLVERVTSTNAGTDGIAVLTSRQVHVRDNRVLNARDNGIDISTNGTIYRDTQQVRVESNDVTGSIEGAGIGVSGGTAITVSGNTIGETYLAGIHLHGRMGWGLFGIEDVDVTGNTLTRTNRGTGTYTPGAIAVHSIREGLGQSDGIVNITGNHIADTPWAGIWVGGKSPISERMSELNTLRIQQNDYQAVGGQQVLIRDDQRAKIADLTIS